MAAKKVSATMGYTHSDLDSYKWKRVTSARGVDIQVIDGLGNIIEVNAREGDVGSKVRVNGHLVADV